MSHSQNRVHFDDSVPNDDHEDHDESSTLLFPFIKKITSPIDGDSNKITCLVDELNNLIQNPSEFVSQHSDTIEEVGRFCTELGRHVTSVTNEIDSILDRNKFNELSHINDEEQYEDLPQFDIVMDGEDNESMSQPNDLLCSSQCTIEDLNENNLSVCYPGHFSVQDETRGEDLIIYTNWNKKQTRVPNEIEVIDKVIHEYMNHSLSLRKSNLNRTSKLIDDTEFDIQKRPMVTIIGLGFNIQIASHLKDIWNLKINIVDREGNNMECHTLCLPSRCSEKVYFTSELNLQQPICSFNFCYDSPYRSQSPPNHILTMHSCNLISDNGKLLHETLYNVFNVVLSVSF